MGDTLITVVAIGLAAVLMFVFPLMTMSDRTDDVAQLAVESATTDFVDEVATSGKITLANLNELEQTITSTGNTYDVDMVLEVKDANLGKKASQAQKDKIGENASYSVHTTQIEEVLENGGVYYCNEGDRFTASVKNTSQTLSQQLKNFFYTVTGNDAYTIAAEHTALVKTNGQ